MSWSISCQGSVPVTPGSTRPTLNTRRVSLTRRQSATASVANLEELYTPVNGKDTRPLIEEMKTTRPHARRSRGSTALVSAPGPIRLTSNWWCMSARDSISIGPATAMPALFTRASACSGSAVERGQVFGDGDVELDRRDQVGLRGQLLGGDVGADAAAAHRLSSVCVSHIDASCHVHVNAYWKGRPCLGRVETALELPQRVGDRSSVDTDDAVLLVDQPRSCAVRHVAAVGPGTSTWYIVRAGVSAPSTCSVLITHCHVGRRRCPARRPAGRRRWPEWPSPCVVTRG